MVRAPLKRSFPTISSNGSGNENDGPSDNRSRRQRTLSSASRESGRPSSLRQSNPLTDKGNAPQEVDSPRSLALTATATGRITSRYGFNSQKNLSTNRAATLQQKPSAPPTRIPVKASDSARRAGGSVKLEPNPQRSAATPVLSLHSASSISSSPGTFGNPAPLPSTYRDGEPAALPFDLQTLPSIPSPPASPPALKRRNNQLAEGAINSNRHSRTPSPPTSSMQDALAFPSKKASPLDKLVSFHGPRKPGTKDILKTLQKASKGSDPDDHDIVHLVAPDCQLFVSFADSPHYEAWDMPDNAVIPCPAQIYIMTRDPSRWQGVALHLPTVSHLHIECSTKATSSRFSTEQDKWTIRFEGAEVPTTSGKTPPSRIPTGNISIENKWDRVLTTPTIGKGCRGNAATLLETRPPAPPLNLSLPLDETSSAQPAHPVVPGRGFVMRVWIPIPTQLFLKKETRVFEIVAKVWMEPPGKESLGAAESGPNYLTHSTEMTVSHLRTEREMLPL